MVDSIDTKSNRHQPVLLDEVVAELDPKPGNIVVDGTVGNAGHAQAILKAISPTGHLIGLDADPLAITESREILERLNLQTRTTLVQANFGQIRSIVQEQGIDQIDRILLDLGLRRGSLEDSGRGFSFQQLNEPLDMRFDPNQANTLTAAQILNSFSEEVLADIFYHLADERLSRRYARAIVVHRDKQEFSTVADLVQIIEAATPKRAKRPEKSSATKVFQALRMTVNQELEVLDRAINTGLELLPAGGRISVITFHSIEDRQVKQQFRQLERRSLLTRLNKKPTKPSRKEIINNRLSRSATLRTVIKN
jgi:16S rRNA (cytosine1402-N4)-methyltransferase